MEEFLEQISAFPTVIYTTLLLISLLYWGFVIIGAADLHVLDAADGGVEGLADGVAEGGVGQVAEGMTEVGGGLGALVAFLKLRNAPMTVVLSLVVLLSWVLSFLAMVHLAPMVPWIPTWLFGAAVLVGSFATSLPLTSFLIRPLGALFHTRQGGRLQSLVGEVCRISTGRVTDRFGQATVADGGAGLVIQVRCRKENPLKRGEEALIVDYDRDLHSFLVEPIAGLVAPVAARAREPDSARVGSPKAEDLERQGRVRQHLGHHSLTQPLRRPFRAPSCPSYS